MPSILTSTAHAPGASLAVADLLGAQGGATTEVLLTPAQVASRYGVSRTWVYAHAKELGAVRLGNGPKARLRFDADKVDDALADNSVRDPAARGRAATSPARRAAAEHTLSGTLDGLPDAWRDATRHRAGRR